ncbi:MAG TPA: NADH-quinone oxidoreductase subunit N [Polyangiaceae bacterium]|nr:NADH-quinone oxidoreductase subunit N [Polyangiaceae bacterium]
MPTVVLDNFASLRLFAPELGIILGILLLIVWDLVKAGPAKLQGLVAISIVTLGYAGAQSAMYLVRDEPSRVLFGGLMAFDRFAHVFRILFAAVTAVIIVFSTPGHEDLEGSDAQKGVGEFFVLLLVITLGLDMMAMSRNLLMIYLSLELVSIISFILAGYKINDRKSSEAGLKYVIFGGVASGIMLYGMSWLFGLTQSLNLAEISRRVVSLSAEQHAVPEAVFVAVVCMLAGFGYKISAAPFHMWTPDVYEGAPTSVTAFLSVGPKAAGFAILLRFFSDGLAARGGMAGAVATPWPIVGGLLAMATMTIGNLSALGQNNVKRMLAFSSIAHAGYMLLGFCVFSEAGTAAILFYVATYCFMNLGAFLVVMAVAERSDGDETIEAFCGLGTRSPVLAICMAVFLFSLTGLPPFAGFVGKFYIFASVVRAGGPWNWVIAVVGVLNSVVSLFYYARVLRAMYLTPAQKTGGIEVRRLFGATTLALAVPTIALGIYWGPVYDFVARSLVMVR